MPDRAWLVAAAFYFCAPVTGITGTTSYNEAALVFFTLAAFYLLLVWRDTGEKWYLPAAGLAAGFCYALKLPGAIALVGAAIWVAVWGGARRWRGLALLAAGAAPAVVPWLARNWAMSGDPLAPLGNALFPNPYFHLLSERVLAENLAAWGHVTTLAVPWQLAFGDGLTGTFGPLLLALPLALLAWRSRSTRLVLAAALLLALPWFSNKGARFLMPSMALAGLALGAGLAGAWRGRAALAAVALQAIVCWPQALNLWTAGLYLSPARFSAGGRSAHRTRGGLPDPSVAGIPGGADGGEITRRRTRASSRFGSVANAYLARAVTVNWQSAEGDRITDAIHAAFWANRMYQRSGRWPAEALLGVRFRLPASHTGEWDVAELEIYSKGKRVPSASDWTLSAQPNLWEAPLALDHNYATRWRTWRDIEAGMALEVDFRFPVIADGAALVSGGPCEGVPLEIWVRQLNNVWRLATKSPPTLASSAMPQRRDATAVLRSAGFGYILAQVGDGGDGPIGADMLTNSLDWDMDVVARAGLAVLCRIR